ncbi:hypothetical protein [Spirilliplanes yamanashiensis]|uniref:Uncharacterized protein n=1 Tax=Spirilliplanes yamanashiensis TaxID=42233 RepID=A0A8J3YBF1_9ACTN|nr:hypothetical protein [Spirilliplanes yamanashiensis]MDP9818188.1 hypothetical protein [Spirilliplanes yamanashiensis]GIJ04999.1 hypothetical protein Sya03_43510 [Spirilliplanes yamanashiensis]
MNPAVEPAARWSDRQVLAGAALVGALAVAVAPVAAVVPPPLLAAALAAAALAGVAYLHPPAAAYLVLLATPLTAGFPRGMVVPLLRPHEALTLVVGTGVALRTLVQLRTTRALPFRPGRIDAALLLMACAGSVLPLLWMVARGVAPTQEDLLYASALWKFYALYVLVRISVRTEREVGRALRVSIAGAAVLAVVAILQSLNLAGVPDLLVRLFPPEDATGLAAGRGSATLGSSISVGDVMAFHVAICLGLLVHARRHRGRLLALTALFALGTLGSGQVSAVIGLAVCVTVVAVRTGQVRRLLVVLGPAVLVGAVLLWPVIQQRLAQRQVSTGVPQSWYVRYEHLRRYVWPDLLADRTWTFGVRPGARIQVDTPWGHEVYIESGHTWLLWTGGVPLFAAFLWFMWVAVQATASIARGRGDAVGVAATASLASLVAVFVLMTFDPHITMRGAADLMFALLALAVAVPTGAPAGRVPRPAPAVGRVPWLRAVGRAPRPRVRPGPDGVRPAP